MTSAPRFAWLNGTMLPWDRCMLHARTQGAMWGANVFEGVRAYWVPAERQLSVFRLDAHLARLRRSMKCVRMPSTYSDAEITGACLQLLRANEFRQDVHIVIVAYFGLGQNFDPMNLTDDTGIHITAIAAPRSTMHGAGLAACMSSWRRISDDTMPPRIKTGANYHNSRLAYQEAVRNGYDTALFLNQRGQLAEGPGSCLVMVREGSLVTPPGTSGVLEGITLASVTEIARRELGIDLQRREIDRTELYVADEAFLCGTLHEVLPLTSVDRVPIGDGAAGPVTRELQRHYDSAVRAAGGYRSWATPVYVGAEVTL